MPDDLAPVRVEMHDAVATVIRLILLSTKNPRLLSGDFLFLGATDGDRTRNH